MAIQPKSDTAIKVDTITEKTTDAGVTIETVLIEDGTVDGVDVSALLATLAGAAESSVQNTASTSYTTLGALSQSVTVATGQRVLVVAVCNCSHDTVSGSMYFRLHRDSTEIGSELQLAAASSGTSGVEKAVPLVAVDNPGAGTYTYTVKWKTNTGTLYSRRGYLATVVLKQS